MSTTNDSATRHHALSNKAIQRIVWIALIVLLAVLSSFAAYYIADRYVRFGDQSPVQIDIQNKEQDTAHDPQNPEVRIALAESYLRSGQPAEAIEQVEQVLRLYPDNANALLIAGIAHARMNRPEEALAPLQAFVAMRKDGPMARADVILEAAYYFLGESYVKLHRPEEAIPVLEAALLISPTDADALYQAGLAYQATGQPEIALERYHKAVRLVPDFVEVYQGMAEIHATLDQPDYEKYARGMVAFSKGNYRTAVTYLEQATAALHDFAPAFLGLGLAHERMGTMDAALPAIQRTLELSPDDLAAQQALGRITAALNH